MINQSEREERAYLETIITKLSKSFQMLDEKIEDYAAKIQADKEYIWDNITQFDAAEKAANRIEVQEKIIYGENAIRQKRKIAKLMDSPYFGRVDFTGNDEDTENALYIGIHTFTEGQKNKILIYDWRAPVSSLFYNFEVGHASYVAPMGLIAGEISLKRQYKIKNSVMEFMIESSLNIDDEILQKELSQTSNDKMKNIVATIQREQNAIIRNESAKVLIIQGVAGSGKTSIALHRVAFLLYRFKGTLSSRDVLIISPNKVFGDYISNVLPELGEEEIVDIGFEEIADNEILEQIKVQTFEQQVSELIDCVDEDLKERIKYKATTDFVLEVKAFLEYADMHCFCPDDLKINDVVFAKEELRSSYIANRKLPIMERFDRMATIFSEHSRLGNRNKVKPNFVKTVKATIAKMFQFKSTLELYMHFYDYIGKPLLFEMKEKGMLEYADVFPYVYFKMFFEGAVGNYRHIKHLLVDEMQDYTPIQYQVLAKLFHCKMTILGDSSQSVNPYSSSTLEEIRGIFKDSDCVELCKSYRCTIEIMNFAQGIRRNSKLIPIERHGEEPRIVKCATKTKQFEEIEKMVAVYLKSGYHSLGIVCKTQVQAKEIYEQLKLKHKDISLLSFNSKEYKEGIIISTAHMAKGLEFDEVIVPFVNASSYQTEIDKSMLYIACTRAMHKLGLTYFDEISPFLKKTE